MIMMMMTMMMTIMVVPRTASRTRGIGYAGGGIGGGGGIALSQIQQQYDAQMGYIMNILPEWILTKPVEAFYIFNNTQQQTNPFYYAADFSVPQ